jgi:Leucine-rich repeat (LRR) protein
VGNELSEIIPGSLENIKSLEWIKLEFNRLEHLDIDVFSGLIKLEYINLSGNKLQYLHPDTFLGLPNLKQLYLGENKALHIPTDSPVIISHSLTNLYISNCTVNSVSVETFANVSALKWLDLSYNNLRTVDINILRALPTLSKLYLYGNPLQCDCQLQEVWRWCEDRNIRTAYKNLGYEIVPNCDTPREVNFMWWGVLEKAQCLEGNVSYHGDYSSTR